VRREETSRPPVAGLGGCLARDRGRTVRTLDQIAASAGAIEGVRARDVHAGDWLIVRTRNSVYAAAAVGDGTYDVAGGWFSGTRTNLRVGIAGCTWGGGAIHTGLVAAPGMFLEFANGVRTTRIQHVRLIRAAADRAQ
jgi:hypothetical protein